MIGIMMKNTLKRIISGRYTTLCGIIIVLWALLSAFVPYFFSFDTFINIIKASSVLAILAVGMTYVILTGGVDLSVGSNVAVTSVFCVLFINATGATTPLSALLGVLAALVAGAVFGLLNGVLIGYLEINPFMVTLATLSLGRGLTLYLTDSTRIGLDNVYFNWLGNGSFNIGFEIPGTLVLVIPIVLISAFILRRTVFGMRTFAIGGNSTASRASGINVKRQTMMVYVFTGLMCGFSSIITIGRVASAQPLAAEGLEFEVITAVVLGGTSLKGGVGTLAGTMLGVLVVGIINIGINLINVPIFYSHIVKGAFVLIAVLLDQFVGKYRERSSAAHDTLRRQQYHNNEAMALIQKNAHQTLTLKNISKGFSGVQALSDVTLNIKRGQVHALAGENGAGKSTLMKILSGVFAMDEGEVFIDDLRVSINNPIIAKKFGISIIYQELAMISELDIRHNIFLGKEVMHKGGIFIAMKAMTDKASELLSLFSFKGNVRAKVKTMSIGQQQMIEIAKVLNSNAWVVIMDEPTSALGEAEKENLFKVIQELKAKGIAIVYISHRMQEIFEIADEVTVLRDGKVVANGAIAEFDEPKLISALVGRELTSIFTRERCKTENVCLEVKDFNKRGIFEDINFHVNYGEVVGFSGLIGARRTEIMRCIFGLDKLDRGQIYLDGKQLRIQSPKRALECGICYVSEDRRREGIVPLMNVKDNICLSMLHEFAKGGWINETKEIQTVNGFVESMGIKTPSVWQLIGNLSGGNQQKCCVSKMLACKPKVLILDEPTRGIDVGAKAEIHHLVGQMAKEGIAVILISSELPEIIGMSDRIIVLSQGKITKIFEGAAGVTQEMIMENMV